MIIGWWKFGGLGEKEEGVKAWVACLESIVWLPEEDELREQDEEDEDKFQEVEEEEELKKETGLRVELKELVQRESFLPIIGETLSLLIGKSSNSLSLSSCSSDPRN